MNRILTRIFRHILTTTGAIGFVKSESIEQLVSSVLVVGSIVWSILDEVQKGKAAEKKPTIQTPLSIFLAVMLLPGCAKFSGYAEKYNAEGRLVEKTHMRGFTLFDGKAEIAKGKALQTDKTQSVGVQDVKQESTGETVQEIVKGIAPAIIDAITKP